MFSEISKGQTKTLPPTIDRVAIMDPVQFFKSLADDTRLRCILLIYLEQELCVCELTAALDETQPKISRHLAQLRKCQLLVGKRQGQWVFYRLNPALAHWAKEVIQRTAENSREFLHLNHQRLAKMGERPERTSMCC